MLASMGYQIDVFACSDSSTYPKDSKIDQFLQEVPSMRIFTVRPSKKNFYRTASITSNLKCVPHNLKVFFKTGFYYNGISTPFAVLQAIEDLIKSEGGFHYDVMITRGFLTDVVGITLKKKYGFLGTPTLPQLTILRIDSLAFFLLKNCVNSECAM